MVIKTLRQDPVLYKDMDSQYSEYLKSDAWKAKRKQRLIMAKHRCAVCHNNQRLHVHHLTYARIFNEDMADLLPLCEDHHTMAEKLVKKGKLSRGDNVLFLATETVRLLALKPIPNPERKPYRRPQPESAPVETRNSVQDYLLSLPWFVQLLHSRVTRRSFVKRLRYEFQRDPTGARSKRMANGCVLYERHKRSEAPPTNLINLIMDTSAEDSSAVVI